MKLISGLAFRPKVATDEVLLKERPEKDARKNEFADAGKYMMDDVAMFTVEATEEEFANLMAHLGGETISMDESKIRLTMVESADALNHNQGAGGRGGRGGGAGAGGTDGGGAGAGGGGRVEVAPGEFATESTAPTGAVLRPMQGYRQSSDSQSSDKPDSGLEDRQAGKKGREGKDGLKSDEALSKPGAEAQTRDSIAETGDLKSEKQLPLRRRYLLVIRFQPDGKPADEAGRQK